MKTDTYEMGLAHSALAKCAGVEYAELPFEDQRRLCWDFLDAEREDECSAPEYVGRIGRGNLAEYLKCLRAGDARRA